MDPFIAQIVMFGGNFAPRGWAFCDGQLLAISSNSALFSLVGTIYGGDGRTSFGLPDLRGRVAIHPGNGPGLSSYRLGEKGGIERVALTQNEMPNHSHSGGIQISEEDAVLDDPNGNYLAITTAYEGTPAGSGNLNGLTINPTGGGQPHYNIQPFQCVNYIIALQGVFPSRS